MNMLTGFHAFDFSEDIRSPYRARLILESAERYALAQSEYHVDPTAENSCKVEYGHALLMAAALPPSAERDEWKRRGQEAADAWAEATGRVG